MDAVLQSIPLCSAPVVALVSSYAAHKELHWRLALVLGGFTVVSALVAATLVALGAGMSTAVATGAVCATCLCIAEIDRRLYLIPDLLVIALLVSAVAAALSRGDWTARLTGAMLLTLLFLGVRAAFHILQGRQVLGLGDCKLAGVIGALLGAQSGLLVVACAGAATAIALMLLRGGAPQSGAMAPFGVALSAGLAVASVGAALGLQ